MPSEVAVYESGEVASYPAGSGITNVLRELEYAPLPWQTHPIDTAPSQSQGWGPFHGPYSPWDFDSAKDVMTGGWGLDITWDLGDNAVTYAPPYAVTTLMQDRSVDLVSNQSGFASLLMNKTQAARGNGTFAGASDVQTSGLADTSQGNVGFWRSLGDFLRAKATAMNGASS